MESGDEDIHTKIENYLTDNFGEVGKKIHTGKSRNDQILTDIKLFEKDNLSQIAKQIIELSKIFKNYSSKYKAVPMPGYTHMQKAMPTSVGMWAESFAESCKDDLKIINNAIKLIDKSPLGSAAGYGVNLPLDKQYTAKLLGFSGVQNIPNYCQNSKGKMDLVVIGALHNVMLTINKFASDVMLFTTSEFGFFDVDKKLCTGSSIMPQKKNVDVAELLKAKTHKVLGNFVQVAGIVSNLISGYNRDFQETKKPIMESFEIVLSSLKATKLLIIGLTPDVAKLKAAMTDELYATQKALDLVAKGISFRDAYKLIKK